MANIETQLDNNSLRFLGTLGGNVIDVVNARPAGLSFYANSNNPTNCPANIGYGAYLIMKQDSTHASVFCWDNSHFACVYGLNPTTATSINWNAIK